MRTAKYPRAHRCRPQNALLRWAKLLKQDARTDPSQSLHNSAHIHMRPMGPPARECGRWPLSPTISRFHAPSRSAESGRAHEAPPGPSVSFSDISESTPSASSNRASCARPVGTVSRDHITRLCSSLARRGVSTTPEGDTIALVAARLAGDPFLTAGTSNLAWRGEANRTRRLC